MIVYASGNADGNAHSHTNLPVILAGSGGGKLQTGRFHKSRRCRCRTCISRCSSTWESPAVDRFGDSNNRRVAI